MITVATYLDQLKQLSTRARFSIGLRIFERYGRLRGLEDESLWEYLSYMWQFPLLAEGDSMLEWEKNRCELADYGLGDELPEELEEELYALAISEDYFELWVSNVTELAWTNILQGPQDEESMQFLKTILELAVVSNVTVPELEIYKKHLFSNNNGWGSTLAQDELESWQANPCMIELVTDPESLLDYTEQISVFD